MGLSPMTRLPYRGYGSRIFLPFEQQLDALGPGMMPYAFALYDSLSMGGAVGAQQTARGYTTQEENCWITHLVGSSQQAAGFVLQVYDSERKLLWTPQPIVFSNALGTAQKPFWLKKIYKLPAEGQLACRVTNLAAAANLIQVVAWGVRVDHAPAG